MWVVRDLAAAAFPRLIGMSVLFGRTYRSWTFLSISSLCFLVLFGSQTLLVKYLNDDLGVVFPWFSCILLTGAWPVNGVIYFILRIFQPAENRHKISRKLLLSYCALGALDALHMSLLSYGLNYLPGSQYMVIKSTSLLWTIVLSRLFVRNKILTKWHWVAVTVLLCGVTVLGLDSPHVAKYVTRAEYIFGFAASLGSAFANGAQIVAAEKLLAEVKKNRSFFSSCEIAFLNGLASNVFVLALPFISGEFWEWRAVFDDTLVRSHWRYFILACIGIALSKQLGYLFKFGLTGLSSALYTEMLDMCRRAAVVVLTVVIFHEFFGWHEQVAMVLMLVGIGVYVYGGTLVRKMQKQMAIDRQRRIAAGEAVKEDEIVTDFVLEQQDAQASDEQTPLISDSVVPRHRSVQ